MAASALVPPLQLDASNIKPKQPAPPSLSSVTTKLVVFYSREGTTKKIGLKIAEHIHADVVEVVEDVKDESNAKKAKKGSPRGSGGNSGGLSFVKLCYRAKAKTTTPVTTKTPISLEGYDTLYIGSPVHANHLASPCRSWLQDNKLALLSFPRAYHFFTTTWSTGANDLFKDLSEVLGKEPLSTLCVLSKNADSWEPTNVDFFDQDPFENFPTEVNQSSNGTPPIDIPISPGSPSSPSSPRPFTPGSIVSRYEIFGDEQLGHGTFSIVYKGKDKATGEIIAIKVLQKKELRPATMRLLKREMVILRKISHRNIVKLRDVFETETEVQMVLDFIPGGELWSVIVQRGVFTEVQAQQVIRQLLEAVDYMHSNGVIHRDLKPENLLCTSRDASEIKITDFGLATDSSMEPSVSTPCGTPSYVAPEVFRGLQYDNKCDIWSIGVILYVLLSGYLPFDGESLNETMDRILAAKYYFPRSLFGAVSANAKDLISQMFTVNPAKRPSAAECLEHPWLQSLAAATPVLTKASFVDKRSSFYRYYQENVGTTNDDSSDSSCHSMEKLDQYY